MKEQVAETVLWITLLIPILFGGWVALGYYLAAADLGVLYKKFGRERFGVVVSPKAPKVLFNSSAFVLLKDPSYVAGRFCPVNKLSEAGNNLEQYPGPNWFERTIMGAWFIGWPFIDELFRKELSWIGVGDGKTFTPHNMVVSDNFAISKLYVLKFKIVLGSDKKDGQVRQASQNITLWVYIVVPVWIYDPYTAMVKSDWMQGLEGALGPHVQKIAETMDLNEMNAVTSEESSDRGQLADAVISNATLAKHFGVEIDTDGVHQAGYEFENDQIGKAIREAMVKRYEAIQQAGADEEILKAGQAGAARLAEIVHELFVDLTTGDKPLSEELAKQVVDNFLRVQTIGAYKGDTYVEGGAQTPISINTGNRKKGGGK